MYVRTWLTQVIDQEAMKNPVTRISIGKTTVSDRVLAIAFSGEKKNEVGATAIAEITCSRKELGALIERLQATYDRCLGEPNPPDITYQEW